MHPPANTRAERAPSIRAHNEHSSCRRAHLAVLGRPFCATDDAAFARVSSSRLRARQASDQVRPSRGMHMHAAVGELLLTSVGTRRRAGRAHLAALARLCHATDDETAAKVRSGCLIARQASNQVTRVRPSRRMHPESLSANRHDVEHSWCAGRPHRSVAHRPDPPRTFGRTLASSCSADVTSARPWATAQIDRCAPRLKMRP